MLVELLKSVDRFLHQLQQRNHLLRKVLKFRNLHWSEHWAFIYELLCRSDNGRPFQDQPENPPVFEFRRTCLSLFWMCGQHLSHERSICHPFARS